MFQPASLKGESPVPIDEELRKKAILIYYLLVILSFLPVSLFEYTYIIFLWKEPLYLVFILLFPFNLLIVIHLLQLSALILSNLFLIVVNLIHTPKEGRFKRDIKDKDYLFWNIRNLVKKWPLYITSSNPFPWWKNRFALRFFGVKIGKKCLVDNTWMSSEFLDVGNNVILGMNSTIISFGIEQENFIIKKIIIQDNVLVGAKCSILPGTHIKKGAILAAHSYTNYQSMLEKDKLYGGHPAKLIENRKQSR